MPTFSKAHINILKNAKRNRNRGFSKEQFKIGYNVFPMQLLPVQSQASNHGFLVDEKDASSDTRDYRNARSSSASPLPREAMSTRVHHAHRLHAPASSQR